MGHPTERVKERDNVEHLLAWYEAINSATLVEVNNVEDGVVSRNGTERYSVPGDMPNLLWAAATGDNITLARITAPSLGVRRSTMDIVPRQQGDEVFDLTHPQVMVLPRVISVAPSEELAFEAAEEGATTDVDGFLAITDGNRAPMPPGEIRQIRGTGTTTLGAHAWTGVVLTPELTLEPGLYEMVGFYAESAGAIVARANLESQRGRPGLPALAGAAVEDAYDFDPTIFDRLMWYSMGKFTHTTLPEFEFFSDAADTAEVVTIFAIRLGPA